MLLFGHHVDTSVCRQDRVDTNCVVVLPERKKEIIVSPDRRLSINDICVVLDVNHLGPFQLLFDHLESYDAVIS